MRNTSQDSEYEGLPYQEKKLHKTHFQGGIRKGDLPVTEEELIAAGYERIGPGRWRCKNDSRSKETRRKGN